MRKPWALISLGVAGFILFVTCLCSDSFADESILILYNERLPYCVSGQGGSPSGLTCDPAKYAFAKSGLPHRWEIAPTKRQMDTVVHSTGKVCIVGWFKNPEREKIGKFTSELYKDKPTVAVVKADNPKMTPGKVLYATLADKSLTLLVKEGFSYGKFIDESIKQLAPKREFTLNENLGMLKMIKAGRADYMFMAPEEAEALIESNGLGVNEFKLITFSDMPEGESRYLLCTKEVPDADVNLLNTYLEEHKANNTRN